jgi:glutathione synthase/RimK-type ligase-like ATP-grasp enzyme
VIDLRVATCTVLPEVDVDEAPLMRALTAAGIRAQLVAWDDPAVDWDAPVPTLLRSTWNYALHVDAFLAWVERVARSAPLWNPPQIVRGNVHKAYLLDLAKRGVPVTPTMHATSPTSARGLIAAVEEYGPRIVIKPEVGAGSLGTRVFDIPRDADDAVAHLSTLLASGTALVQPYIESVEDYGERSLVWIDGELSHAIRKSPRFSGEDESVSGPFPIADDERAVAEAALEPYASQILYARVDIARDPDDEPMVMELEMIEPSLFFARQPGSVQRFVNALSRRLGA